LLCIYRYDLDKYRFIDYLWLQIKIAESSVPTLVNGITPSNNIVIGAVHRFPWNYASFFNRKKRPALKRIYVRALISLLLPIFWLWTTYAFLTLGMAEFLITYALSGLATALTISIAVTIFTVVKMTSNTKEDQYCI